MKSYESLSCLSILRKWNQWVEKIFSKFKNESFIIPLTYFLEDLVPPV